ncbi:MAG: matrixin family metalloprotease, partial [Bryobacteraceae bacterium]
VPILWSKMEFWKDLTINQQASYFDTFFLTIVHEFGHAQGLQHTLTSGAMATSVTRGTTKAQALTPDDIAGVSLLYPAAGYVASTGSISGTVLLSGNGVNLGSVVAVSTNGIAISSLTNPDGTYRIDGVPPGQYYVYVHPLPPPEPGESTPDAIVPPEDLHQNQFQANINFDTQFFGGTRDWTQTPPVSVNAGNVTTGVNFNVQSRPGPTLSGMVTYVYEGGNPVQAGPLPPQTRTSVVFYAAGALVNNDTQLAPGLNVSVIGGTAQVETNTISFYYGYVYLVLDTFATSSPTPITLAVTVPNDMYVLPMAFTVVTSPPPTVSAVSPGTDGQGNPTATIFGSNINSSMRVLFDGARANMLSVNPDGSLVVSPPPASAGYQAAVEVLSNDDQTSSEALVAEPPVYSYSGPSAPAISVSPSSVTSGTDVLVQITGYNTNFISGRTTVGFGSCDILVRQVWVQGVGSLLVDISVAATAPATLSSITVATGLQVSTLTTTFQIAAAVPGQVSMHTPVVNQVTGLAGTPVGGTAVINTTGLPANLAGWTLLISSQQVSFSANAAGQLIVTIPSGFLTGPAVVQLISPSGATIPPIAMQIDPPPPVISAALNAAGAAINGSASVKSGDSITLIVSGLADSNNIAPSAASVQVSVGGVVQTATTVTSLAQPGACAVQVVIPANLPSQSQTPVILMDGTRVSGTYFVNVQN